MPHAKRTGRAIICCIRLDTQMIRGFPKKLRLKRNRDFTRAFARRCSVADGVLVMYLSHNTLDVTRLGLRVGRRLGPATVRNRTKRLLREAFRRLGLASTAAGYDLICIPRSGQILALREYEESLGSLFARGVRKLAGQTTRE